MKTKRTLLDMGQCQARKHPIHSEDDVKIWTNRDGAIRMKCCKCIQEDKRKVPEGAEQNKGLQFHPQQVFLDCGHETLFRRPVPIKDDVVYCPTCRDYSNVTGRGAIIELPAQVKKPPIAMGSLTELHLIGRAIVATKRQSNYYKPVADRV